MNRIMTNKIIMAVILIVVAGCSESNNSSNQIPSKVFIPASDFSQTLWISLQTPNVKQIPEGEWDLPPKKCAIDNLVILHNIAEEAANEEEQIHRRADHQDFKGS